MNRNSFGENFAKQSPNQSKNMTGVYLSLELEFFCYCAVNSARF